MANKIDTLHPKDDLETNIYPNIVSDNIPSNAITTDKIKDGSVTNTKLDDGCVTNDKIKDDTILGSKINTNTNITCNTLEATNIIGTQMIGQYVQADIQLQANNDLNVLGSSTLKGKVIANGDLIVNGTAYFTSPSITGVASVSGLKSPANMAISAVTDIDFIIGDYTISVPKASGTIALKSEVEEESEKREFNDNELQEQITSEVGTRKEADSNLQEQITNAQNAIDKRVSLSGDETITGTKTFTSPVKTDEIDNTNGNAILRYKSTENKVVLGGSTIPTTIMGSGDRPTYSKNGSDFSGNELALKSDVDTNWSTLMANLGIGRWANQAFYDFIFSSTSYFYDKLMPYYTNFSRFMANSYWVYRENGTEYRANMVFDSDFPNTYCDFSYAFYGIKMKSIELPNLNASTLFFAFSNNTLESIKIKDGCKVNTTNIMYGFYNCPNLIEIGAIDCSNCYNFSNFISNSPKVKSIHIKHFKVSFDISASTAFEESDLVEIISNLDTVTTAQTLTMGATNLAKLTDDEKKVATDKGWVLA